MVSANTSNIKHGDGEFPSWLTKHLNIEWDSNDVDALLDSIDASQSSEPPTLPHLAAELLVLILEHVPVAYVLDWRSVCRGFRDAIDGPILYHHLQRTQLVGYLGPRHCTIMRRLGDQAYEDLHLVQTNFGSIHCTGLQSNMSAAKCSGPVWKQTHAVFNADTQWRDNYDRWKGAKQSTLPSARSLLSQLEVHRSRQGFGTLIWAIKLDTAVLDLDLPLDPERRNFDIRVDVDLSRTSIILSVEWKPMLFQFLKTEAALRRLMEQNCSSKVTFSHAEDCLRAVRRQRLHASLDLDNKMDRHIKWSLRLLRPLWGRAGNRDRSTLDPVEDEAIGALMILRRTAALIQRQLEYLQHLAVEYNRMVTVLSGVSRSWMALKTNLLLPGHDDLMYIDMPEAELEARRLPLNTVAWSDAQRMEVEARVQRWKAQESLIAQMSALMVASQEARSVPENAFDTMGSDF